MELSPLVPKYLKGWNFQSCFFENFLTHFLVNPLYREGFLLPIMLLYQLAGMIDLIGDFIIAGNAWTGNIQNEMDARYQEKSMLTNLFTEHKFWGWAGLLSIFLAICAIFYYQYQAWEQEDQEQR